MFFEVASLMSWSFSVSHRAALAKSRGCGDADSHAFKDKVWAPKIMAQAKCVAKNLNIEKQK
jgi:hypothetical protein